MNARLSVARFGFGIAHTQAVNTLPRMNTRTISRATLLPDAARPARHRHFSRRSFLQALAAGVAGAPFLARGMRAQPPSGQLRHASFGASGMAWSDLTQIVACPNVRLVAVADVDTSRTRRVREQFPEARIYQDWRELLEREGKHLDSVNVSVPDHMHAVMALSAMQRGLHVYVQKPLAHDLWEVRQLTAEARRRNRVSQMGIQVHATGHYRMVRRLVQDGVIGPVREVHCWCPKSWGDPSPRPERSDPVPPELAWDLWVGVCAARPFIGESYYHPDNWRKRLDFGTGTLGDMGCHILDPIFGALELSAPVTVRSEGPPPNPWNWPIDARIRLEFPGTKWTASSLLPVTWYDGDQKLPAEVRALLEGDEPPNTGSILVGTKGVLVVPHVARPLLYPDRTFRDFKYPEIPSGNHWAEFVNACRGEGRTSANFDYAGPLTEAVLVGGVAMRFPQTTLRWNAAKLEFDSPTANTLVRRKYRKGWQVGRLG